MTSEESLSYKGALTNNVEDSRCLIDQTSKAHAVGAFATEYEERFDVSVKPEQATEVLEKYQYNLMDALSFVYGQTESLHETHNEIGATRLLVQKKWNVKDAKELIEEVEGVGWTEVDSSRRAKPAPMKRSLGAPEQNANAGVVDGNNTPFAPTVPLDVGPVEVAATNSPLHKKVDKEKLRQGRLLIFPKLPVSLLVAMFSNLTIPESISVLECHPHIWKEGLLVIYGRFKNVIDSHENELKAIDAEHDALKKRLEQFEQRINLPNNLNQLMQPQQMLCSIKQDLSALRDKADALTKANKWLGKQNNRCNRIIDMYEQSRGSWTATKQHATKNVTRTRKPTKRIIKKHPMKLRSHAK